MLRFVLKKKTYDGIEHRGEYLKTLDADVPELERMLTSGGYGGGPNGDSFEETMLVGVEVLAEARASEKT